MVPLADTDEHSQLFILSAAFIGNIIHFTLSAALVVTGWNAALGI